VDRSTYSNNEKYFSSKNSLYIALLIFAGICIIFYFLSVFDLWPETERMKFPQQRVMDVGNNFLWLGMEVSAISKDIRREFNIPRKVKGVFVINEGRGIAFKKGIRTGDIICSVNKKPIKNQRNFVKVVDEAKYYDGILIDIYSNAKRRYVSIPYHYVYGPVLGPNKGHWQLGSPLRQQMLPYGTWGTHSQTVPK